MGELKRQYYSLALMCHPDNGGAHDDMAALASMYAREQEAMEHDAASRERARRVEQAVELAEAAASEPSRTQEHHAAAATTDTDTECEEGGRVSPTSSRPYPPLRAIFEAAHAELLTPSPERAAGDDDEQAVDDANPSWDYSMATDAGYGASMAPSLHEQRRGSGSDGATSIVYDPTDVLQRSEATTGSGAHEVAAAEGRASDACASAAAAAHAPSPLVLSNNTLAVSPGPPATVRNNNGDGDPSSEVPSNALTVRANNDGGSLHVARRAGGTVADNAPLSVYPDGGNNRLTMCDYGVVFGTAVVDPAAAACAQTGAPTPVDDDGNVHDAPNASIDAAVEDEEPATPRGESGESLRR